MSDNTYDSHGLRLKLLYDLLGKNIKFDTLFNNLYDYWTVCYHTHRHHTHQQTLRGIVDFKFSTVEKLEMNFRRKWSKDLPNLNIVLEKYKEAPNFLIKWNFWKNTIMKSV